MTFQNESGWDRIVRGLIGLALLYAGWQLWSGPLMIGAFVIGALALVTAVVGWCPAYSLLGWSTCRRHA